MHRQIKENYELLAEAIVRQAISDYREALRDYRKQKIKFMKRHADAKLARNLALNVAINTFDYKDIKVAIDAVEHELVARQEASFTSTYKTDDCERFFASDWCKMLTNLDGEWIMENIRKQEIGEWLYGS